MLRVLAFGDSITFGIGDPRQNGWAGLLQKELQLNGQRLYNLGIPGDTSADVCRRFSKECGARISRAGPSDRIVVLFGVGTNDSKGIGRPERSLIPLDAFRRNLAKLNALASAVSKDIVFVGLVPVDESRTTPDSDNDYYTNNALALYNACLREHCASSGLGFADFFDSWLKRDYASLLSDGLHPNAEGYRIMYPPIRKHLSTMRCA